MESTSTIIVVGAGVLGLSTAVVLQEMEPQTPVVIVAHEFPPPDGDIPTLFSRSQRPSPDYASMWAGAHYRPIPPSTPQLAVERQLALKTYERMRLLAQEHPESTIEFMKGVELLETPSSEYSALQTGESYAGPNDQFRTLATSELPQGVNWGCEYETYTLSAPAYCRWLLKRFKVKGGIAITKKLERIEDVFCLGHDGKTLLPQVVVNCSGRNFGLDPKMQIIRGQTVLVRQNFNLTITRQHRDGSWTFLIPRPLGGGTIVGGTKEPGDTEESARSLTRAEILQRAARYFPDYVDNPATFDVLLDNVGRRPWREGGLKIEKNVLANGGTVIHAYGAGGRGFELSWGVADAVAHLVDQVINPKPKL